MMENLMQDLRYGMRMLFKNPGFTAVAVFALALGIGANSAIFSVVDAVLLRPLPYKDPNRLVMVWERPKTRDTNVISPANFLDWQDQSSVFEQMAAFYDTRYNFTGVDNPEELPVQVVSDNMFSLLGVNAILGRTFTSEDAKAGQDDVAILSHGLWQRRFGGDPGVIGRTILLNGRPNTVIGVMPPNFQLFIKGGSLVG